MKPIPPPFAGEGRVGDLSALASLVGFPLLIPPPQAGEEDVRCGEGDGGGPEIRRSQRERVMNPLVVIPSRLAATRLPGKPLADIHGEPMIVHVWRRAVEAAIGPVVVACGDAEIAEAIERAGGRAVMTD